MQRECISYEIIGKAMIDREIEEKLFKYQAQFPVVVLLGPRQSGKTTISEKFFKNHLYVSLENLDTRLLALSDPRQFLASFKKQPGVIFDEIWV